jgi:hypothetical protein
VAKGAEATDTLAISVKPANGPGVLERSGVFDWKSGVSEARQAGLAGTIADAAGKIARATSAGCRRRLEWNWWNCVNRGLGLDRSGRETGFGSKSSKPAEPTATLGRITMWSRQAAQFARSSLRLRSSQAGTTA